MFRRLGVRKGNHKASGSSFCLGQSYKDLYERYREGRGLGYKSEYGQYIILYKIV